MTCPSSKPSNGRFGWISGQLDPRLFTETDQMMTDADELRAISPNVMIKVPASMQGIEVLKVLTSKGISTNTTTCFTLPQIMASANAAMDGIAIAEKNKVDMSNWRAVITMMIGRLTENPMRWIIQAERKNIKLSWADKHWYGIAVFRRAYKHADRRRICQQAAGLLDARRPDWWPASRRYWDIQKIAGGDIVYTCPPYVLEPFFELGDDLDFEPEIEEDDAPARVMDKMLTMPYCIQAYDPNGLSLEQFNIHPATVSTVQTFTKGFPAWKPLWASAWFPRRKTTGVILRED